MYCWLSCVMLSNRGVDTRRGISGWYGNECVHFLFAVCGAFSQSKCFENVPCHFSCWEVSLKTDTCDPFLHYTCEDEIIFLIYLLARMHTSQNVALFLKNSGYSWFSHCFILRVWACTPSLSYWSSANVHTHTHTVGFQQITVAAFAVCMFSVTGIAPFK